jgi:O-antigen/teichoic acid export membrane protein
MAPLWSAYTEAATKNDYNWIKSVLKKQLRFFILTIILAIVLLVIAKPVIALWMGKRIAFSNTLLLGMAIYTILNVWNSIFSSLLGGLSKIRLGTFLTLITAGLNIPLSLFLIEKMNFDPGGVIFATSICLGVTAIISPIQTYYFVYSKKKTNLLTKLLS